MIAKLSMLLTLPRRSYVGRHRLARFGKRGQTGVART